MLNHGNELVKENLDAAFFPFLTAAGKFTLILSLNLLSNDTLPDT